MKVDVYNLSGKPIRKMELPAVFETSPRLDLIKRAFLACELSKITPRGPNKRAGMRSSAKNWGTGFGISRVPRIKAGPMRRGRGARKYRAKFRGFPAGGRAALISSAVGGRRIRVPGNNIENINKKERRLALASAIANTARPELVKERGHIFTGTVPIIVEDKAAHLKKTKDVWNLLQKLGLGDEMERAKKKKIRPGKIKRRTKRYKKRRGPLFIYVEDKGLQKAGRNIPGLDLLSVKDLSIPQLSPGAHGARLTIWLESAIKKVGEMKW
jgi:large subunit ribosomal protein L4e